MVAFATEEWVVAFKTALNESQSYADAAKDWEGDFYMTVNPVPNAPFQEARTIYLDLYHGQARDAYLVSDPSTKKPEFEISTDYDTWRKVVSENANAMMLIMSGKLKVKGNMGKLTRNMNAAQELLKATTTIGTEFPTT